MVSNERNNTTKLGKGRGTTLSPIEFRSKPASRKTLNNSVHNEMSAKEAYGNKIPTMSSKNVVTNDIFAPKTLPRAEERELPALGRAGPIDYSKINEDDYEHQKPDQTDSTSLSLKVDSKLVVSLDKLTSILGPEMAKKACADKWYFQQEAITKTINQLKEVLNDKTDQDVQYLIEFIADICADVSINSTKQASKAANKPIKHLKKRLQL